MSEEEKKKLLELKIECVFKDKEVIPARNLQDVYILVDRPDFLHLIDTGRGRFKFIEEVLKVKINLADYGLSKDDFEIDSLFKENSKRVRGFNKFFEGEAAIIMKRYNLPYPYREIIIKALLTGVVNQTVRLSHVLKDKIYFRVPCVAIMPTPTTTKEEIKKVLDSIVWKSKTRFSTRVGKEPDVYPNIDVMRKWYWERIEGKTLKKIADDWVESHASKELNTTYVEVLKAIQKYEKLLNRDVHFNRDQIPHAFL